MINPERIHIGILLGQSSALSLRASRSSRNACFACRNYANKLSACYAKQYGEASIKKTPNSHLLPLTPLLLRLQSPRQRLVPVALILPSTLRFAPPSFIDAALLWRHSAG